MVGVAFPAAGAFTNTHAHLLKRNQHKGLVQTEIKNYEENVVNE
jgi:hypothetical protein